MFRRQDPFTFDVHKLEWPHNDSCNRNQTPSSGNVARYDFELLREIGGGNCIHCAQIIADDSLQCSCKPDQRKRVSPYDCQCHNSTPEHLPCLQKSRLRCSPLGSHSSVMAI